MGSLSIRDDLILELNRIALTRGQRPEALAEEFLSAALSYKRMPSSLRAQAEAIAALTPKGVKQTDSTLLVREDRR